MITPILILLFLATTFAFHSPAVHGIKARKLSSSPVQSKTKLDLFLAPQIGFAAACAGAVFAYVYSNIDSIKEVRLSLFVSLTSPSNVTVDV